LGLWLSFVALGALLVLGLSPAGSVGLAMLEARFPPWHERDRAPAGIIILGGSSDTVVSAQRGVAALNEAAERFIEAGALARRFPNARLVFTGGDGRLVGEPGNEADDARMVFAALGVDPARIAYERDSRNTWENAMFTRRLIDPKPGELWLLVTSAWHMPRSMGVFRAAGFDVEAYPVDFRTTGPDDVRFRTSVSEGMRRVDVVVRELIGLVAYRVTGRSSALFPAP
jgi:uncharacterized SAM-binding protein YcdF (DUF218 family)